MVWRSVIRERVESCQGGSPRTEDHSRVNRRRSSFLSWSVMVAQTFLCRVRQSRRQSSRGDGGETRTNRVEFVGCWSRKIVIDVCSMGSSDREWHQIDTPTPRDCIGLVASSRYEGRSKHDQFMYSFVQFIRPGTDI